MNTGYQSWPDITFNPPEIPSSYYDPYSESYFIPLPLPEPTKTPPPYCSTLDLDRAKCDDKAQRDFTAGVQNCSSRTWWGAVGGAIIAGGFVYFTGGAAIPILVAGGGGTVGGGTLGNFSTGSCQSDWLNWKDSEISACRVSYESKKLDCAQF